MESTISLVVAVLALFVSGLTAWFTLLRRGSVKMTQPTVIYFGADRSRSKDRPHFKVFLRTLLYATAVRGCMVESMYVRLRIGDSIQNFSVWVYGDERLTRGSGLFIPQHGITLNHHFLLPFDGTQFTFVPGTYFLDVFASVVNESRRARLFDVSLPLAESDSSRLSDGAHGVYFDWSPDSHGYHSHVRSALRPEDELTRLLRDVDD